VVRDENGIPHIRAGTLEDLYFAQGFVHAQDRFWQLAFFRQLVSGRLSEWLGRRMLEGDRRWRVLDLAGLSEQAWNAFPEDERTSLEAYSRGVNAWLASDEFRRPPEMVLLHLAPAEWHPTHSILLGYYFHLSQMRDGGERQAAALDFVVPDSTIRNAVMALDREVPAIIPGPEDALATQGTNAFPEGANSNSWTLAGEHTASGKPLMANDPHTSAVLPAQWQLQRHDAPGIAGAGATFPGIPGLMMGHNGSLAWAMTNAQVDAGDITWIQPHPEDATRYRRSDDGPWESFQLRVERFSVRFGAEVVDTVRTTTTGVVAPAGSGPSITDRRDLVEERRAWGLDLPGTHLAGVLRLQRAGTVEEGIRAVEAIPGPMVNLSLADTAGSIAYVTLGRIAARPEAHARTVAFGPEDSNDGSYLPFADNPRLVNPPSGRIVTSNQRIIGPEYPHYLTAIWSDRGRARRIHEMLDERETHDAPTFHEMQNDAMSPTARELVPFFLGAEAPRASDAELLMLLAEWDYRFALDDPAPTVFVTWVGFLDRRIVSDEVPDAPPGLLAHSEYRTIAMALSGQRSEWCDDRRTGARESCAEVLALTLRETRDSLDASFGTDLEAWKWGTAARFVVPHAPFSGMPVLGARFSRSTPIPGGPESLFTNYVSPADGQPLSRTASVPLYQAIYDLADLEASLFMAYGGASGHFASPFYDNLVERWVDGERFTLPSEDITPLATLTLQPGPGGG
jgi:penicillin amidase